MHKNVIRLKTNNDIFVNNYFNKNTYVILQLCFLITCTFINMSDDIMREVLGVFGI